jgi:branched-chain amino acid transport system ATP-binding protein
MAELLRVENLSAGYGEAIVLNGVSFALNEGETLALLGRNGTGKTTLINTLAGATRQHGGTITLAGVALHKLASHERAAAGIGWVPQERNIFKSLTVEENITAVALPGPWNLTRAYEMFPRLKERRSNLGNQLSGGEQQMLAIARALVLNPKVMLLDEPTEGLAPIIIEELLAALTRIIRQEGMSAIVVEQHAQKILGVTDRAIILDRGTIVHASSSRALIDDPAPLEQHLGVTGKKKPGHGAAHKANPSGGPAQTAH